MMTKTDLEALGWVFDLESLTAKSEDGRCVQTTADTCPLFFLVRAASHLEGDDALQDADVTADLVSAASGETWVEPPPPPPTLASNDDVAAASAEIVNQQLALIGVESSHVGPILDELLSQARSAVPYYEGYTLHPDPATAWTNFQALPQATKDRLLFNTCRSLAALMRYLSGDLPTS